MISSWRDEWQQGDFPFYFVQLAPFDYNKEVIGAALRDQQRRALKIPNTGMAVTLDIGDPEDIHPLNKLDVGKRLSLWALAKTYGKDELVYSGPLYESMQIEDHHIRLYFEHVGAGLLAMGGELTHFTIAGDDRVFYQAKAEIVEDNVLVYSDKVKNPLAVRYAFENGDEPNLFNLEGLPASTFRTDDWKIITQTPTVSSEYDVDAGSFMIAIESDPGLEIRYTLDGSDPIITSEIYTRPFILSSSAIIKSKLFDHGEPSLFITETSVEKHLATGCQVTYFSKYSDRYTAGGNAGLVNSMFGSVNFMDGNWQGFQGDDLEVVIDLVRQRYISKVTVNCLQVVNSWIMLPERIEVFASLDGKNFEKIASIRHEIADPDPEEYIHAFVKYFDPVKTRYVKVMAKNYGPLPEWHQGAGNDSWIFVDEIVVN